MLNRRRLETTARLFHSADISELMEEFREPRGARRVQTGHSAMRRGVPEETMRRGEGAHPDGATRAYSIAAE